MCIKHWILCPVSAAGRPGGGQIQICRGASHAQQVSDNEQCLTLNTSIQDILSDIQPYLKWAHNLPRALPSGGQSSYQPRAEVPLVLFKIPVGPWQPICSFHLTCSTSCSNSCNACCRCHTGKLIESWQSAASNHQIP